MYDLTQDEQKRLDTIREKLFSDEKGVPYPFIQLENVNGSFSTDLDAGILTFAYRSPLAGGVDTDIPLHELGHYFISRPEGLQLSSWGLSSPNYVFTGLSGKYFTENSLSGDGSAHMEARVWAWQHLFNVMCGFSEMYDIEDRSEIRFLPEKSDLLNVDDDLANEQARLLIEKELEKILIRHPNGSWVDHIRAKISQIKDVLAEEAKHNLDNEDWEHPTVLLRTDIPETSARIEMLSAGEWKKVVITDDEDLSTIVTTRSDDRANSFYLKCCAENLKIWENCNEEELHTGHEKEQTSPHPDM